ncbi:Cys/Met metabolism PLP-dependent enzyme [Colletotrichum karsti]|uniref:Cys/Met metabolism PLP-dependent enzyme n=1 Tax=Colletotrichum karsti TaxID=1095194 RepID=A0A9P6I845_9PEZI|nr:Cys/Met metabolism PLP-dependent enzyme [Colletotrichum karsti]KAF9878118.1 Cys/Met metabolism PLP-dependent enzyme [Colletotrichum karsti]
MASKEREDSLVRQTLTADMLHDALSGMSMATRAVHSDDFYTPHRAIAPGMHVAVNYRYARNPEDLKPGDNTDPNAPEDSHVYSRYTAPNSSRLETILKNVFGGHTITYTSGLSAFHAMMVCLNPRRIFIGQGYHGVHGVIDVMTKLTGVQKLSLENLDEMRAGDIVHVETPLNPTGEAANLAYFSSKARAVGAYLSVDATFAPPPLQDPLQVGADMIMHSGTKYIGGHSDMLCGILVVHPDRVKEGWVDTLYKERQVIGSVMGSFEGWLGIRSIRTLHLRVMRQSQTCTSIVAWLVGEMARPGSIVNMAVAEVRHASLQTEALQDGWLQKQMPGGFGAVFSLLMKSPEHAKRMPSRMYVFQHATSLGGVESLMEWRSMSDAACDKRLLRLSCGVEDLEDLKADLAQGMESLLKDFPVDSIV